MPTSWYQAIPEIVNLVVVDGPRSILDIGVGFGKYGLLLREVFDIPYERYEKDSWHLQLDGIEGYEGYNNPVHDYVYNNIYYGNIFEVLPTLKKKYDTLLLIDVLEHFDKKDGLRLIDELLRITNKSLIISTPLYPAEQGEYLGNDLETHKSRWNIIDFIDYDFRYSEIQIHDNGASLFKIYPTPKKKSSSPKNHLNIGYLLPHQGLTGGVKMLLSQMEMLRNKGHHISAFLRGVEGQGRVIPSWSNVEVDREVIIPYGAPINDYVEECDVVVVGWVYQMAELKDITPAVFYWEQGHEWLFGDIPPANYEEIRGTLKNCYKTGMPVASVSACIAQILKTKYNLDSEVIPNGIDTEFYKPIEKLEDKEIPTILLVGNPSHRFKAFGDAMKTLNLLWNRDYKFNVKWVCQSPPGYTTNFPLELIVHPPQEVLVQSYQEADLFLFTSLYEGFGMPPLEAMACGLPVVTTDCGGTREFAIDGYNCLVAEPGDVNRLAEHLEKLLNDNKLRKLLSQNGRETALNFRYEYVVDQIEEYMKKII
ncbi:MAG: glycosyltransferase [Psychrobacillus sp.]